MQIFFQGPIRSLGMQKKASYMSLASYYLIGIPIALVLVYKADLGVLGLQGGFAIAQLALGISFAVLLFTSDWKKISNEAIDRVEREYSKLNKDK